MSYGIMKAIQNTKKSFRTAKATRVFTLCSECPCSSAPPLAQHNPAGLWEGSRELGVTLELTAHHQRASPMSLSPCFPLGPTRPCQDVSPAGAIERQVTLRKYSHDYQYTGLNHSQCCECPTCWLAQSVLSEEELS